MCKTEVCKDEDVQIRRQIFAIFALDFLHIFYALADIINESIWKECYIKGRVFIGGAEYLRIK